MVQSSEGTHSVRKPRNYPPPQGYTHIKENEKDTGLRLNPTSPHVQSAAIRKVLMYLISDALDLIEEEEVWAGWQLDDILSNLMEEQPHSVPFSARQEMLNGTYTKLLEARRRTMEKRANSNALLYSSTVKQASANDWAEAILGTLQTSYNLHPLDEMKFKSQLVNLFSELGVGNANNPRGAAYIPSDIRRKVQQGIND